MADKTLPLCPCGSGKLYEECCFKKKGPDGEPLFFKGVSFSNDGENWHPIPNIRFAAIVVGQVTDKYRAYAKEIVANSTLSENNHEEFVNDYGLFYQSYEQLLKTIATPSGKGVSFQMDNIETRNHWREYLFNGRILLDFLGLHSRETLELKQDIGGLNDKSFKLILDTLVKLGEKDRKYLAIKDRLESIGNDIINFISLRDKEKTQGNTIIEFPAIDSEYGLVKDGKVSINNENHNMIDFVKKSHSCIHELTLILLSNNQKLPTTQS